MHQHFLIFYHVVDEMATDIPPAGAEISQRTNTPIRENNGEMSKKTRQPARIEAAQRGGCRGKGAGHVRLSQGPESDGTSGDKKVRLLPEKMLDQSLGQAVAGIHEAEPPDDLAEILVAAPVPEKCLHSDIIEAIFPDAADSMIEKDRINSVREDFSAGKNIGGRKRNEGCPLQIS